MTKKHFEAIARLISEQPNTPDMEIFVRELAVTFKGFNRQFDTSQFLRACGIE